MGLPATFFFCATYPEKKLTSFCADETSTQLTKQYNNTELKRFCKSVFLVFLKKTPKTRIHGGNVSSKT